MVPPIGPIFVPEFASRSEREPAQGVRRAHLSSCICRRKVGHLVRVGLYKGWAGHSARDIAATGGIGRQSVEPVHKAQHIGHEDVGDGEDPGRQQIN
jgi:hypothetical protein